MANKKFQKQYILTPEQLNNNLSIFQKTNEKYKLFTDELLEYLSNNGFFTCPASTVLSLHNCFEGGLLDHEIRVAKYASDINKILPNILKQEITSIIKVCFLHSIGKTGLYEKNDSKWHKENLGQYFKFKEQSEIVAMRVGERSAYLSMKYGIELTDLEYQGIVGHDKMDDDKQAKWYSDILTIILKQAIQLAMMEEKKIWEEFNKD